MISDYAISTIEELQRAGYFPTPADIIRLNALGLKIEKCLDDNPLYLDRRCAFVGDCVLREPTIGHNIRAVEAFRYLDPSDTVTRICLYSWLLATDDPPEILRTYAPRGEALRVALSDHVDAHFKGVTFRQLKMAVEFCLYGYDSAALERPATIDESGDELPRTADDDARADAWNFDVGILHEAQALALGLSLADAKSLTQGQLLAVIDRAILNQQSRTARGADAFRKSVRNKYITRFEATVDEIKARLEVRE